MFFTSAVTIKRGDRHCIKKNLTRNFTISRAGISAAGIWDIRPNGIGWFPCIRWRKKIPCIKKEDIPNGGNYERRDLFRIASRARLAAHSDAGQRHPLQPALPGGRQPGEIQKGVRQMRKRIRLNHIVTKTDW